MKEKPRLKDTDEILNSIGKRSPLSTAGIEQVQPVNITDRPAGDGASSSSHRRRPGNQAPTTAAPQEAEQPVADIAVPTIPPPRRREDRDDKPLDFGKYELPKPSKTPVRQPARPASTGGRAFGFSEEEAPPRRIAPATEEQPAPRPSARTFEEPPAPPRQSPPAFEEQPAAPRQSTAQPDSQPAPPQPVVQEYKFPTLEELDARENPVVQEYQFEPLGDDAPATDSPPAQGPAITRDPHTELLEDESYRESFMQQLSSRFEEQFTQKFEGTPPPEEPAPRVAPRAEIKEQAARPWFEITPKEDAPPAPADDEAEAEAESFLNQFAQEVQQEEEVHAEEFKDTLAEKFMRERERYLRELGIADRMEEEAAQREAEQQSAAQPPQRRKLDFQIQPEMHRQEGELPPVKPVTYNRAAMAQPQQEPKPEPELEFPSAAGGKKTSEQLLLELGREYKQRPKKPVLQEQPPVSSFQFSFETPEAEEPTKNKKIKKSRRKIKGPSRVTWLAMAAAMVAIALFAVSASMWFTADKPVVEPEQSTPVLKDQETFYENRNFPNRAKFNDVIIPRNISVQNMTVQNRLVIEDISTPGSVRLENVTVGGVIYVKSCAMEGLELHDVLAERVVINNSDARVKITASGATEVGTVELRTPATVEHIDLVGDSPGVRNILAKTPEAGTTIDATLKNTSLYTLASEGEAVLGFEGDTFVETMTSDGSLSLSGTGKVVNLAVGEDAEKHPLTVLVKGVSVSNLNIKSPATVTLGGGVDKMATSDSIQMGGNGALGSLALNTKFGNGRLLVDIAGLNVQDLMSNAEARISATGSTQINTLTANESTYALGNKVNHLIVNANNVIYEKEPDKITTAAGIGPPQTVADNPNLDFMLSTSQFVPNVDASADDIATTCGHPRDSGGFIKGDGSRGTPFEVATPAQLAHVTLHLASHFIQTGNIDIADESKYSGGFPIIANAGTPLSGVYDGGGFGISNLRVLADGQNGGLFAENTGIIQNVHLVSGEVSSNYVQRSFVGGLVGLNYEGGTITGCSNGAKITGNATAYVGGITGYNYGGRVKDCYNAAKITGADIVGGIVGMNKQNASVTGSYNVGTIGGSDQAGAVAGTNDGAVITNCYYLTDTAPVGIGSGTGTALEKSSDDMRSGQMVIDLTAGNDSSPWTKGSADANGYNYPMLKIPAA